jgi:tetratricopeptide (TPR) repeat protein
VAADELFNLATQRQRAGAPAEAEQLYRQVLMENANHAGAWNRLGQMAHQDKRYEQALPMLARACELAPGNAEFHFHLGRACAAARQLDQAQAAFGRCVQLQPNSAQGLMNLGVILRMRGDITQAIVQFRRAIAVDPNYVDAYACLALALRMIDDRAGAVEAYRRIAQLRPTNAEAHANLGDACLSVGRIPEAIQHHERAASLQHNGVQFQQRFGAALLYGGFGQRALAAFGRALSLQPDDASVYWSLADAGRMAARDQVEIASPLKLPYLGDKIVLLTCDRAARQQLRAAGLHGGYAVDPRDGGDLWLNVQARASHKVNSLTNILGPWLEWTRNEAAMAGKTCTVWMEQMPPALADAVRRAAGEDLIEVSGQNAEQIGAELAKRAVAPPGTDGKVFAIVSIRNGGVELLPHWLEHYSKLGVDEMLLGFFDDLAGESLAEIDRCAQRWNFKRFPQRWTAASEAEQYAQRQSGCRSHGARPGTWIMHTDLDELHEYPAPLRQILDAAVAAKTEIIGGQMVDRVTADGSLPRVRPTPSLWEQFPVSCRLTAGILKGGTSKVMLGRYHVPVRQGHHVAFGHQPGPPPVGEAKDYRVAHFKWHGDVVSRMRWGLAQPQPPGLWKAEAQRFLSWLDRNGEKINLNDPALAVNGK